MDRSARVRGVTVATTQTKRPTNVDHMHAYSSIDYVVKVEHVPKPPPPPPKPPTLDRSRKRIKKSTAFSHSQRIQVGWSTQSGLTRMEKSKQAHTQIDTLSGHQTGECKHHGKCECKVDLTSNQCRRDGRTNEPNPCKLCTKMEVDQNDTNGQYACGQMN